MSKPEPSPDLLKDQEAQDSWLRELLQGRISHERLALVFVLGLYVAGILLTSLLIVRVLSWGLLSSFGRVRMMGLLISFASLGLLASRVVAGRYGNRLAARWLPHSLGVALPALQVMRLFGLRGSKELQAFVLLHKLHVYSVQTPLRGKKDNDGNHSGQETVRNLPCVLEPLFTHDVYLPMMRSWLLRTHRLWFDADEIHTLVEAQKKRYRELTFPDIP